MPLSDIYSNKIRYRRLLRGDLEKGFDSQILLSPTADSPCLCLIRCYFVSPIRLSDPTLILPSPCLIHFKRIDISTNNNSLILTNIHGHTHLLTHINTHITRTHMCTVLRLLATEVNIYTYLGALRDHTILVAYGGRSSKHVLSQLLTQNPLRIQSLFFN